MAQTKLKSREKMIALLKDKVVQDKKVEESRKIFEEKPVIPDLKSHMSMRKR